MLINLLLLGMTTNSIDNYHCRISGTITELNITKNNCYDYVNFNVESGNKLYELNGYAIGNSLCDGINYTFNKKDIPKKGDKVNYIVNSNKYYIPNNDISITNNITECSGFFTKTENNIFNFKWTTNKKAFSNGYNYYIAKSDNNENSLIINGKKIINDLELYNQNLNSYKILLNEEKGLDYIEKIGKIVKEIGDDSLISYYYILSQTELNKYPKHKVIITYLKDSLGEEIFSRNYLNKSNFYVNYF